MCTTPATCLRSWITLCVAHTILHLAIVAQVNEFQEAQESTDGTDKHEESDHVHKSAKTLWGKARIAKIISSLQIGTEEDRLVQKFGLSEIKQAKDDAIHIMRVMRNGIGSGKSKMTISVGLFQVLGELPDVLSLPALRVNIPGFPVADILSYFQLDLFAMFKIDCLAKTSIYAKFIFIMILPMLLLSFIQLQRWYKQKNLDQAHEQAYHTFAVEITKTGASDHEHEKWLREKLKHVRRKFDQDRSTLVASCRQYSYMTLFFLYPMLNKTGTFILSKLFPFFGSSNRQLVAS